MRALRDLVGPRGFGDKIKVYRVKVSVALLVPSSLLFLIIGVGMLAPASHTGLSGMVVGIIVIAFSVFLFGHAILDTRLVVDADGIVYWKHLRKRTVLWSTVKSFHVGISNSLARWPCLVIDTSSGRLRIDNIAGTRGFVEKLVRELQEEAAVHRKTERL
jgi:hypothetical protein